MRCSWRVCAVSPQLGFDVWGFRRVTRSYPSFITAHPLITFLSPVPLFLILLSPFDIFLLCQPWLPLHLYWSIKVPPVFFLVSQPCYVFVLTLLWCFIWCGKFILFIHIYKYRMSDLSFSGRTPFNIPPTSSFLAVRVLTNQPPEQVSFTDTFISFTDISHFHSNLCHTAHTTAYHSNWLLEHQT